MSIKQVGGSHYEAEYQHWDWADDTHLPYLAGCATKYLVRWRMKNGIMDLEKAKSYIQKLAANAEASPERWPGNRAKSSYDLMIKFLKSSGVGPAEVGIIVLISGMTTQQQSLAVVTLIEQLIHNEKCRIESEVAGNIEMDMPFGYSGEDD